LVVGNIDRVDEKRITTVPADALSGRVKVSATNAQVQEGARRFAVTQGGAATAISTHEPINLARETNGDVLLLFTLKVDDAPDSATLALRCEGNDCRGAVPLKLSQGSRFVRYGVPLKCFAGAGAKMDRVTAPFILETRGKADYSLSEVRLGTDADQVLPCK